MRRTFILLFVCSVCAAAAGKHVIVVVRHAERAGGMASDVQLSDAGRCRAEKLARMLADARIGAIYTSEVARTQQTAAPLAERLKIRPKVVPAKEIERLVQEVKREPGAVLVVGHSNTVPEIVEKLGAGSVPPIGDAEFDRMFVVTLIGKDAQSIALRYPGCGE